MPNYVEYEYGATDEELYATNLYSGTDADLDNTAPVDDTDGYTSNIDLTQKMFATIDFTFTGSGSTDDLLLKLFKRRDNTWDGDEIAIWQNAIPNDGSEDIFSFTIDLSFGPGHYRFSMQSAGGTDTFDILVEMRRVRMEIPTS
jgi:hypothetical protein